MEKTHNNVQRTCCKHPQSQESTCFLSDLHHRHVTETIAVMDMLLGHVSSLLTCNVTFYAHLDI